MADNHTKEIRSMNMSHISSKNAKPEEKYKTVVFVNGCFWHKYDYGRFVWPSSNVEHWHNKISRNIVCDAKIQNYLLKLDGML